MRFGLVAAALLYGGLALASGFDRLSSATPSLERLVPPGFRARADVSVAAQALARKDAATAERHAVAALAASPVSRFAMGALASAWLMQGKDEQADAAFRVSGQLGWRDLATQLYWYSVGIESEDYTLAAQRADAVLRANPEFEESRALLGGLEQSEEGRKALLDRLVERPNWITVYARPRKGASDEDIDRQVELLIGLAQRNVTLGCTGVRAITFWLVDNGRRRQAYDVWSNHCTRAGPMPTLFDPTFQALSGERRSPFDWQAYGTGDVTVRTVNDGPGREGAEIANASAFVVPVLSQRVELAPGTYRVHIEASDRTRGNQLFATLSCSGSPRRTGLPQSDIAGAGQVLTVPACGDPLFALWARPAGQPVVVRRITLEPIR